MTIALRITLVCGLAALSGCGFFGGDTSDRPTQDSISSMGLNPGETPQMRALINEYADVHDIPAELLHMVIQRESDYRAEARNGPYWGLMQILPETARQMGHRGPASELLEAETNLLYAGRYLRGAYIVADGDLREAVRWYASGYYYEARNRCLLVETGLRQTEVRRYCG